MRKAWFKLTRNATGRQLLWELVTTESGASGYRTTGRINLKRHQMKNLTHVSVEDIERKAWENLAYVPVEQLREDALLLLTQTAAQSSIEKLSQLAKDIVCAVIYQHLGKSWEPVDEYDTPPTYDPHWSKKLRHGEDI